MTALAKLNHRFECIAVINEASPMLGWDSAVMMPAGGAPATSCPVSLNLAT